MGVIDYSTTSINKLGYASEASGTIRFRSHTIITNPNLAGKLNGKSTTANTAGNAMSASQVIKQQQVRQTVEDILQNYRSTSFAGRLSRSMSRSQSISLSQIPARSSVLGSTLGSVSLSTSISAPRGVSIVDALNANERAERVAQILAQAKAKSAGIKPKPVSSNADASGSSSGAENDRSQMNQASAYAQASSSGEENEPLLVQPQVSRPEQRNIPPSPRLGSTSSSLPLDSSLQSAILLPSQGLGIASRNRKASLRYADHDDDDEEGGFIKSYIDDYGP
jgi:hypothetical protein